MADTYNFTMHAGVAYPLVFGSEAAIESAANVFAVIRKHADDVDYVSNATVTDVTNTVNADDTDIKSAFELVFEPIHKSGQYVYDVFWYKDGKPYKKILEGKVLVLSSVSDRGYGVDQSL